MILLKDDKKINDNMRNNTRGIKGTRVIVRIHETGEVVFESSNKTLAAGSAFSASTDFDYGSNPVPAPATPSYNTELGLYVPSGTYVESEKRIYLFAIGTDGCAETGVQQYEVDYTKWISASSIVPFRYPASLFTDAATHNKYGGRATVADKDGNTRYAYYFKTFDNDPLWVQHYIGSDASIANMYNNTITNPLESYVELNLSITDTETREWFTYKKGSANPYVNTISLVQGTYITETGTGFKYYKNLHPVTKYNFPTESLKEETKGLDFTYQLFY